MKMNYKHLGLYVLAGIVSGGLCFWMWYMNPFSDERVRFHLTAVILAIAILVAGRYISDIQLRSGWLSPVILIVACAVGWNFAFEYGASNWDMSPVSDTWLHEPEMVVSGLIGGIGVAIGLALAWKLNNVWVGVGITILAGLLGGFLSSYANLSDEGFLFPIWQATLLLGIGIAVQIDSAKSSAEQ